VETDIESRHSDIKYKYSFVSIFILLALLVLIFFSVSSYAASNPEIIIDSVNIGDSLDEAGHNLFGFGPIEPATHGGGWGGADDGNLRVIWFNDSANPSDVLTQSPDENYASAQLSIPTNYIPTKIEVRLLDGIADDSFEIYLNNDLVYTYSDQGSTETWETHEIDLSSMYLSGLVEIKIKSTAPNWTGFDTYGQLGVSWINLYAIEGEEVTVKLVDSKNNTLENGYVEYHRDGWKEFGTTDSAGEISKLVPKGKYTFRMTYYGACVSKRQDISVDPVVIFNTVKVSVKLQNSNGIPLSDGNASVHSGGWKVFGITDLNGKVTKELLPRTYTFKIIYDGAGVSLRQDVSVNSTIVFSTIKVTVMLQDSADLPLFGGNVSYHSGGWKHFGFTDVNGSVCGELLSSKYTFRMGYLDAFVSLRQDLSVDPIVVFSTTKVTVKLVNNSGIPIQGGNVSVHSGGWKFFGITDENGTSIKELLPRTYTFKVIYDGAGVSLRQDIRVNSTVVFSKIKVTVILQDNIGNLLSDGNISYYSAGWKFFGITDDNGSTINELLPRKFTFRATYNGKRYTLRQNVGEDSIVIIRTNTIENYPAVSNPNGPYSGYINQSINFNGSQSYDPDGTIVNYTWDFGDGNISYGVKVEHTYAQIGDYIVNLTVLDNEALSSYNTTHAKITIKQTNTVINKNHYAPSYSVVIYNHDSEENLEDPIENETLDEEINTPPVAKVVFNIGGDGEESISFDASQSCDPDGDDITYRWDFDNDGIWDTNYSRDPLFNYSYSDSCSQGQVRLEVSDGKSSDETTISYVLESHVDQSKEVCGQESSKKRYSLFIEWWVFFVFFIISLIFVLYIYKKRCFIINNIKSSCLIPKNKQKRIGKLVAIIFKLFY